MTAQALLQLIGSGLLMGLIYALIAVGLSLIFGLMDVVNFAHGEMLMLAMYATFGLWLFTKLDPVLLLPAVMAVMFCLGGLIYLGVVRYAIRARQCRNGADLRHLRLGDLSSGCGAVLLHA